MKVLLEKTELHILMFLFFFGTAISVSQTNNEILLQVLSKLESLEKVEYIRSSHKISKFTAINSKDTSTVFFDFNSNDTLIGAKFHFKANYGERVFDGKKQWASNSKEKTLIFREKPSVHYLINSFSMMHSVYELKKLLPLFLKDSTITINRLPDEFINEFECAVFKFQIPGRHVGLGGSLMKNKAISNFEGNYEVAISKKSKLPKRFKVEFNDNGGYIETYLSDYKIPAFRADSIWNYERFSDRYLISSAKDYYAKKNLLAKNNFNKAAPNFVLPNVIGELVSLDQIKKKLVLLEFWYPGCKPCIDAIPKINDLQSKYANELAVFGIEFTRSDTSGLGKYINKINMQYPSLFRGQKTADDYNIFAAPSLILINKERKIIYSSSGMNYEKLHEAIEKNIKFE